MGNRILILGGSPFQVPAIRYARSAGYYTVTCDFIPENPGHKFADEYHNVSTTDLEGVLALGARLKIDGILAYASDPAAPTAAFVSERLGLPGNPYAAVRIMANKDEFRTFLAQHRFGTPRTLSVITCDSPLSAVPALHFPVMVKPVDSSGSKGVSKVDSVDNFIDAVEYAARFSRAKRVIVEEYLRKEGAQIGGEAFVVDGKLVFTCLGDQLVDAECNPYVPTGMTFPSRTASVMAERIAAELQRLITALRFSTGGLNLEIMLDGEARIFLMEVGPRTGGNFLPELVEHATGFNLAAFSVEAALGHAIAHRRPSAVINQPKTGFAYYAIHSSRSGSLRALHIDPALQSHVLERHQFIPIGGAVQVYNGSNCTIGILLLKFSSPAEMHKIMSAIYRYVAVDISPSLPVDNGFLPATRP